MNAIASPVMCWTRTATPATISMSAHVTTIVDVGAVSNFVLTLKAAFTAAVKAVTYPSDEMLVFVSFRGLSLILAWRANVWT